MKNLILLTLILLAACGADHEGGIINELPPPEETPKPEEVPEYECREDEIEINIVGTPECARVNNLYDAEEIEIFYTDAVVLTNIAFKDVLAACMQKGLDNGLNTREIGLLNGIGKDEGYTKDFLLNPEVERTWSGKEGWSARSYRGTVKAEFDSPLFNSKVKCTDSDGNEVTCKHFLCGVNKGE